VPGEPKGEEDVSYVIEDRLAADVELRARAKKVIPGGLYGHQNVASLPPGYPQFMNGGLGCHVWDADGNEYIDLMCSYGPVLLGHRHPKVEEAAARQAAVADCQNGPSPLIVELAEAMTATVDHGDWAIFSKNGTDATTQCVTIARAATEKRKILVAAGAYHGAAPWCTPGPAGVLPEDRAHLVEFRYNDLASVEAAMVEAGDDVAGVVVSPIRHDIGVDLEAPDPAFAHGLRGLCDRTGAVLILDDVRCGLRLHHGSSWEPLGVAPDLSAWSKAIANGYALGAVVGTDSLAPGGAVDIHDGVVLVRGGVDGGFVGHSPCSRRGGHRGPDGRHGDEVAPGAGRSGGHPRPRCHSVGTGPDAVHDLRR
jgi:glutamate-1-semialdehyde 2,1-aminomutase